MWPPDFNNALRPLAAHCPNTARLFAALVLILTNLSVAEEARIHPSLQYPAGTQHNPQPTFLYSDPRSGDIYLADEESGRIAIFDPQRRFNYEFSTSFRLTAPRQVAVDSMGRIFVLGDARQHSLAVFDYNGDFINYLDLVADGARLNPHSFAIGADENLYVLTGQPLRLTVFSLNGEFLRAMPLMSSQDSLTRYSQVFGNLTVQADRILIPLAMIGVVAELKADGEFIRFVGASGGSLGQLSFPIAACLLPDGKIAVLDKHRHLVQILNPDGIMTSEIGICGLGDGSFFHPTAMALCTDGALLVGQALGNRIHEIAFTEPPVASGP